MASSPQAIPVRVRQKTWRQLVVEADPDFVQESENPISYEFANGKRKFRERYKQRGPYEDG